jgi:hypothetical protein
MIGNGFEAEQRAMMCEADGDRPAAVYYGGKSGCFELP